MSQTDRDIKTAIREREEGVTISEDDALELAVRAVRAGERVGNVALSAEDYDKAVMFTVRLIQKYPTSTQRRLACCRIFGD